MVLQKRGRLVTLVLDRNKLGDRGATAIATGLSLNYTLSTLGLSQNQASLPSRSDRDTPVVAAPTLANIEFFRPRRVQISEDGAAAFAQCLIDNSTLVRSLCGRHSSLQRSVHGGVAAHGYAMPYESLRSSRCLLRVACRVLVVQESLDLSWNRLTLERSCPALLGGTSRIKHLDLSWNQLGPPLPAELLRAPHRLRIAAGVGSCLRVRDEREGSGCQCVAQRWGAKGC
jgi:hypothetical protein